MTRCGRLYLRRNSERYRTRTKLTCKLTNVARALLGRKDGCRVGSVRVWRGIGLQWLFPFALEPVSTGDSYKIMAEFLIEEQKEDNVSNIAQ